MPALKVAVSGVTVYRVAASRMTASRMSPSEVESYRRVASRVLGGVL